MAASADRRQQKSEKNVHGERNRTSQTKIELSGVGESAREEAGWHEATGGRGAIRRPPHGTMVEGIKGGRRV